MQLVTLLLMGVPSMVIGLIPSYQSIGYWAAGLLVAMRFLQGIAVEGEWGGAVLMAVEHAPPGRKVFFGSLPQTGVGFGLILSSLAMAAVTALPEADLLAWGWRVPFLASIALVVVGWIIRVRVPESPDFERLKALGAPVKAPILEVLRRHPRELLIITGARNPVTVWWARVLGVGVVFAILYAPESQLFASQFPPRDSL